jgi:hypothetical protein
MGGRFLSRWLLKQMALELRGGEVMTGEALKRRLHTSVEG